MTPAQYAAVGVTMVQVVPSLMWLSDWPLKPLTSEQAASLISLVLGAIALIHSSIAYYRKP